MKSIWVSVQHSVKVLHPKFDEYPAEKRREIIKHLESSAINAEIRRIERSEQAVPPMDSDEEPDAVANAE